ncbi:TIGR01777 family oxidoreductase [Plantactinospora sp. GCM10030261]|uniref:TIGR01777 family oxidoreductase n=1 Tax=Plantactinospora sp. GCM10030261 TaxID=3273420 RepID=UPI003609153D
MRILAAGMSGFLGTRLADDIRRQGHDVVRLVRRPPRGPGEIQWNPAAGQLDPGAVAGVDAVINLAGAGVGDKRWTEAYKNLLRTSRVDTTSTLATAIAGLPPGDRPATLLNSSAIGWYGDTGEHPVEEDAPAGEGFLADLCRVWEAATRPAEDAGVRVVRLRSGYPLHRDGGFLKPQLLPFRLGVGGRFGSGRQWVPWISMADWLAATVFLLDRADLGGPVNVVGPAPVTNAEFTRELAAALHRPALFAVPGIALRIGVGGLADEILTSARVLPGVLDRAGFTFRHPDLRSALRAALEE